MGGSGKTHFLLTAPDPIAIMLFDPAGLKGLMQNPLFRTKDVRVIDYTVDVNLAKYSTDTDRAKAAADGLKQFEEDWAVALRAARTLAWIWKRSESRRPAVERGRPDGSRAAL